MVTITPHSSENLPAIRVRVNSSYPWLAGIHTSWLQDHIINVAHIRGIPPQLVAAQIEQETDAIGDLFNPETFRYEPRFQVNLLGYNGPAFSSYKDYVLKDQEHGILANGSRLMAGSATTRDIVAPRGRYRMCSDNCSAVLEERSERFIIASDEEVTAWDIILSNPIHNLLPPKGKVDYRNPLSKRNAAHIAKFGNVTAQTVIASSYGFLNIMYSTAAEHLQEATGAQRPVLISPLELFDTPSNTYSDPTRTSLYLGTSYLIERMKKAGLSPNTANEEAYYEGFKYIYNRFNLGHRTYGAEVIARRGRYLPTRW